MKKEAITHSIGKKVGHKGKISLLLRGYELCLIGYNDEQGPDQF